MTAPIVSKFGRVIDEPALLAAHVEVVIQHLERPLKHWLRPGQLWERVAESQEAQR